MNGSKTNEIIEVKLKLMDTSIIINSVMTKKNDDDDDKGKKLMKINDIYHKHKESNNLDHQKSDRIRLAKVKPQNYIPMTNCVNN